MSTDPFYDLEMAFPYDSGGFTRDFQRVQGDSKGNRKVTQGKLGENRPINKRGYLCPKTLDFLVKCNYILEKDKENIDEFFISGINHLWDKHNKEPVYLVQTPYFTENLSALPQQIHPRVYLLADNVWNDSGRYEDCERLVVFAHREPHRHAIWFAPEQIFFNDWGFKIDETV